MKQILALAVGAFACALALAANEPVPPETSLLKLPSGAKLVLLRSISIQEKMSLGVHRAQMGQGSLWAHSNIPITLRTGEVLGIKSVEKRSSEYVFRLLEPYAFYVEGPGFDGVSTIGDFTRVFGDTLSIVYDDPDARLLDSMPEDMRQDFLMTRVLNAIKADRHADALPDFERLEILSKQQPESFYYYYIVALDKAQRPTQAKERAVEFLKTYGKQSKYYNDVLAIMAK